MGREQRGVVVLNLSRMPGNRYSAMRSPVIAWSGACLILLPAIVATRRPADVQAGDESVHFSDAEECWSSGFSLRKLAGRTVDLNRRRLKPELQLLASNLRLEPDSPAREAWAKAEGKTTHPGTAELTVFP